MVINVLMIDDHGVLRDVVQRLLKSHTDIRVDATAEDGHAAVERVAALRPDVVVMDISMPALNGLEATRRIVATSPATAVVILSMHSTPEITREAFTAGARGYLLKESAGDEVVKAVRAAAAGRRYLGHGVADKLIPGPPSPAPLDRLTPPQPAVMP